MVIENNEVQKKSNSQKMGEKIKRYSQSVLAINILEQKIACQTLTIKTANEVIKYQNSKKSPKLIDLISDLINTNKESIPEGEDFVVTLEGGNSYTVAVKYNRDSENNLIDTEIEIKKHLVKDKNDEFVMQDLSSPKIVLKHNKKNELEYKVTVDDKVSFDNNSPKPRELQRGVIEKYAEALMNDNPQQLAIMGTGTGKSWVIAGVTHALGGGVIVVPDDALAKEMKNDAIGILQGKNAKEKVHTSKEYKTLKEFEEALKTTEQMILIADDPLFHEKAKLVKNTVVLMDESHQHTFSSESLETLKSLKENNAILALTGTPTTKLKQIIGDETDITKVVPMVDINVRYVMDEGGLRQNSRKTDKNVPSTELLDKAIVGYFGRDEYPSKGKGIMTSDDVKRLINNGMSEEDAVNQLIEKNRQRGMSQKNFLFTGDEVLRERWVKAYQEISEGTYKDIDLLQNLIQEERRKSEIDARISIMQQLHPERDVNDIIDEVQFNEMLKEYPEISLVEEIQQAQRQQIAQSVNTHALCLLFPKLKARDIESMQRQGTIGEFLKNYKESAKDPDTIDYKDLVTGLPEEQRDAYIKLVSETVKSIHKNPNDLNSLCKEDQVNLDELKTKYTASATENTNEKDSAAILDQMRCGLVMHVGSDKKYATGISITSVFGVQQIVSSTKDPLNNPVDTPQLHGRNIRADDLVAFNQQIVSNQVPEGSYVPLEDIYSEDSGNRMDKIFQSEIAQEERKESFKQTKEKIEALKGKETNKEIEKISTEEVNQTKDTQSEYKEHIKSLKTEETAENSPSLKKN